MRKTFVLLSLPILLTALMVCSCSSEERKRKVITDDSELLWPSDTTIQITNKNSSQMASRSIMKSDYKQQGGTCLLASYAFLLEYAGVFQSNEFPEGVYDVFAEYLKFHHTLEPIICLSADQIKSLGVEAERMIGKAINSYCFAHGHIAGYQQIKNFHQWLTDKGIISNIEIISIMPPIGVSRSKPIVDVYQTITDVLKKENEEEYYGALILYLAGKGAHTVFLGYDGDFFIRDSNYSRETGNKASFGFIFNTQSLITEYMLFRIHKKSTL